jgi:hypothetical protein
MLLLDLLQLHYHRSYNCLHLNINEFLLWNAANDYTEGVDYTPKADKEKVEANKKELKDLLLPSLYLL